MSRYIDQDTEIFIKGQWRGESIYDVAEEDPEYIVYILDEGSPDHEDREVLCKVLGREVN